MQCRRMCSVFLCVYVVGFLISCKVLLHKDYEKTQEQLRAEKMYLRTHPENETDLPLIFVGGAPRSGTTLMRTMLEAHHDIRCGPETHILPLLMMQVKEWRSVEGQTNRLHEAGVEPDALNIAIGKFMLEIIKYHAPPSLFYCNKDPLLLLDMTYLKRIFPNSKFVYMIRDGRATSHSIVSRTVRITGINYKSYRTDIEANVQLNWMDLLQRLGHAVENFTKGLYPPTLVFLDIGYHNLARNPNVYDRAHALTKGAVLEYWNMVSQSIYGQCTEVGEEACLPIHYEQLILQPVKTTKKIFQFLDIEWCADVLHHEQHLNTTLSKFERSTNQVQRPLYLEGLTSWFGKIPRDVERDMPKIAPMLKTLGYDPTNPTPNYGEPDDFVTGKLSY